MKHSVRPYVVILIIAVVFVATFTRLPYTGSLIFNAAMIFGWLLKWMVIAICFVSFFFGPLVLGIVIEMIVDRYSDTRLHVIYCLLGMAMIGMSWPYLILWVAPTSGELTRIFSFTPLSQKASLDAPPAGWGILAAAFYVIGYIGSKMDEMRAPYQN